MKLTEKIKARIIHWLGGVAWREENHALDVASLCGEESITNALMTYAKELYGVSADDWSKEMYSYIERLDRGAKRLKRFYIKDEETNEKDIR